MKSKITFLKLASLLLTDNKFSGFDIPKPWTYLVQFMAFSTIKKTDENPFSASLRAIYINMDYLPIKSKKLTIADRTSICIAANRGEFNYLQLPHFLTI